MNDFLDRVYAMSVVTELWPDKLSSDAPFARDLALSPKLSLYDEVRRLLLLSIRSLRGAARLYEEDDGAGTYLLASRPALLQVARAAWIVRTDSPEERVGRMLGSLSRDLVEGGAAAMRKAAERGANPAFEEVAKKLEDETAKVMVTTSVKPIKPPAEQLLVIQLGEDVDVYYGSGDGSADTQILWNASSSLAHGETWFRLLSDRFQRKPFMDTVTTRSFDVVCSGINTTAQRVMQLASRGPAASEC